MLQNRDEALVFICVHAFVQAHALLTLKKMKVFLIRAENVEKNITQCRQEEKLSVALSLGDIYSVLLCSLSILTLFVVAAVVQFSAESN